MKLNDEKEDSFDKNDFKFCECSGKKMGSSVVVSEALRGHCLNLIQ